MLYNPTYPRIVFKMALSSGPWSSCVPRSPPSSARLRRTKPMSLLAERLRKCLLKARHSLSRRCQDGNSNATTRRRCRYRRLEEGTRMVAGIMEQTV